jgi:hypothetical protein
LPDGHDSAVIAQRYMEDKVVLAPGNVFGVSQSATAFLLQCRAAGQRIFAVIRRAMENRRSR